MNDTQLPRLFSIAHQMAAWISILLAASVLRAQEAVPATTAASEPSPASASTARKLTKEEVKERLEAVRRDVLPEAWPPKCDKDEQARKHYLAEWHAVVSAHYIVFTNGPQASCQKYTVTLEELYSTIQKKLPFADLDRLLVAYIFKDKEDYFRFSVAVSGYSEAGARQTAGHANARYYATYYESPRSSIVYHEAAHQVVMACLKVQGVGSWFQEGMAVYFQKQMTNLDPRGSAKNDIRQGKYYTLPDFFAIPTLLADPNKLGLRNYEHAGALLEFMMDSKLEPVAGRFEEFLAAARRGHGFRRGPDVSEELIQDVYGLSLEQFEALWKQHLGIK